MDVEAKVKEIIVEQLGVDEGQVKPEASFIDDLGADSLDTVELVMAFEDKFDIEIPEFTLAAVKIDGEFHHHWYLGTEAATSEKELTEALDEALKEANKNYKVARSKALKGIKVTTVSPNVFYDWNGANKKKGGQVKMARVMKEDKFAEWEAFVNE